MGLGQKLELEAASYLSNLFLVLPQHILPSTPPAPTLIGRCCHDVFKFRTPPPHTHKHASTHTPPGINLPGWERGRSVSLQTFLITGGRRRQFDAGGCSSQGLGVGKLPTCPECWMGGQGARMLTSWGPPARPVQGRKGWTS